MWQNIKWRYSYCKKNGRRCIEIIWSLSNRYIWFLVLRITDYFAVYMYPDLYWKINITFRKRLFSNILLHSITVCPPDHFGPNCAKCRENCQSCDTITVKCTQCQKSYYGEQCLYNCPANCLNLTCDQITGFCERCKEGFHGDCCDQNITTSLTTIPGLGILIPVKHLISIVYRQKQPPI